jgi:hypothetical protein
MRTSIVSSFCYLSLDDVINNAMNISKRVANGLEKYISPHIDTLHNAHNSGYA